MVPYYNWVSAGFEKSNVRPLKTFLRPKLNISVFKLFLNKGKSQKVWIIKLI